MLQQPQHLDQQQQQQQLNQLMAMNQQGQGGGGMIHHPGADMMQQQQHQQQQQDDASMLDDDSKHELILPLDFLPCPNTVIVGRGKKVAQHSGNVRFRAYVRTELEEYSTATTKAHKSSIIVRVLTQVRDRSQFAFVKQNLTTGRWCRVEETSQRITTAQAFRDALKDNYKSSRAHKKLKREEEKEAKNGDDSDGAAGAGDNNNDDDADIEEKEPKKKKKAPASAAKPRKKAAPRKAPPASNNNNTAPSAVGSMPALAAAAAASAGVDCPASPAQAQVMSDLRSMLEQNQNALLSGQARLWNADAPITLAPPAASALAAKNAAAEFARPKQAAAGGAGAGGNHSNLLPKNSNRSVNSHSNRSALNRSLNWSFNSGMSNMSNHSTFSIGSTSGHHRLFNRSLTGGAGAAAAAAAGLNMSNHSNGLNMSRHSNFSGISNFSGHSTGTFTGLVSKFGPGSGAQTTRNPFEPRPMGAADPMDVEMTDVAMGLATARPNFAAAPRSVFDRMNDAHTAAAGIVAAANHAHIATHNPVHLQQQLQLQQLQLAAQAQAHAQQQAQQQGLPLSNLSDHSLMSDFSSIHSRQGAYTAEDIFEEMDRSRRRQLQAMLP